MFFPNSKRKVSSAPHRRLRRRPRDYQAKLESLERRELLSVSPTGTTIAPTEGAAFSGAVATFTATDAGPFTATIDWGDGTTSTGSVSGGPTTFTVNGTNTYADEGTDAVSVVIVDAADSTTATAASTATVGEGDTLTPGTATVSATEGTTFSGAVATFVNTGNTANPASDFTATIDWGDGTTGTGVVSGTGGTLTVSGSHLYAGEGTNPISVVLADDAPGTATATATGTATVAEGDTLTAVGPAAVIATEGTTFAGAVATFLNTGNLANTASDFTATIDWGDGTTTQGTVGGTAGAFTVSGSHLYADEGTNPISVILADDAPGTATATATGTATVAEGDTLVAGQAATLSTTEGATFTGTVATFTNTTYAGNAASDFAGSRPICETGAAEIGVFG
jgi:hypothetical protein